MYYYKQIIYSVTNVFIPLPFLTQRIKSFKIQSYKNKTKHMEYHIFKLSVRHVYNYFPQRKTKQMIY